MRQAGVGHHWEIGPVQYPAAVDYFGYLMKSLVGDDYMAQRFLDLNRADPAFMTGGMKVTVDVRSRLVRILLSGPADPE